MEHSGARSLARRVLAMGARDAGARQGADWPWHSDALEYWCDLAEIDEGAYLRTLRKRARRQQAQGMSRQKRGA